MARQRCFLQLEFLLDDVNARPGPFNTPAGAAGAIKNLLETRSPGRDWDVAILDDKFLIARAEHNLGQAGLIPTQLTPNQQINDLALERAQEWARLNNVTDPELIAQTAIRFAVMIRTVGEDDE